MKSRLWRALTMVLVLALLLPLTAGAEPYAPQSTEPAVIPAGGVGARMDPMTKLDAELRTLAKEGGAEPALVYILARPGVDLGDAVEVVETRAFPPDGTLVVARVLPDRVLDMAANPDVVAAEVFHAIEAPIPLTPREGVERLTREKVRDLRAEVERVKAEALAGATSRQLPASAAPGTMLSPQDWNGADLIGASAAWAKGYTGAGVNIAIIDSGADFGHPDLEGRQATYESGPYAGWPIALDPRSMRNYYYNGLTSSDNYNDWFDYSWYADVYGVINCVQGTTPTFEFNEYVYSIDPSVADLSKSGTIRWGIHPDEQIADFVYDWIPFILLDTAAPGVYDTVIADLNFDLWFDGHDDVANKADPVLNQDLGSYVYTDTVVMTGTVWSDPMMLMMGYPPTWWGPDYVAGDVETVPAGSWIWALDHHSLEGATDGADGIPEVSGGMVYFIADGKLPIPGMDFLYPSFGLAGMPPVPLNGTLVAFMIGSYWAGGGDHGTLCASAAVAGGVAQGYFAATGEWVQYEAAVYDNFPLPPSGDPADIMPWLKPAGEGTVQGAAPGAKIIAIGDNYEVVNDMQGMYDAYTFLAYGVDGVPNSGDEFVDIVSMSYGDGSVHNDGWDWESRLLSYYNQTFLPNTTFLASSGNGGPGFGTINSPQGNTTVSVGASTQYGASDVFGGGLTAEQINDGEVVHFSGRGPDAMGRPDPDVVATGGWGAGNTPLNLAPGYGATSSWFVQDGNNAWYEWGGTSRAAPEAAGVAALVCDAYNGDGTGCPSFETVRQILMSGADDLSHDVLMQGAGRVNADRATDVAAGLAGIYVSPSLLAAGDYAGTHYESFANVLYPGDTWSQTFTVYNTGGANTTVAIGDEVLKEMEVITYTQVVSPFLGTEGPYPNTYYYSADYLVGADPTTDVHGADLAILVPDGADLMQVVMVAPFELFDFGYQDPDPGTISYSASEAHRWSLTIFDWTDRNGDGKLWEDTNSDGVVSLSTGDLVDIAASGAVTQTELSRFTYAYNVANVQEATVRLGDRDDVDNIVIGLVHNKPNDVRPGWGPAEYQANPIVVKVIFYDKVDWALVSEGPASLSVPAGGSATFDATFVIPADQPPGLYEGAITVAQGGHTTVIPTTVNVAVPGDDLLFTLGGTPDAGTPYDNGRMVSGYTWSSVLEEGDWRYYYYDAAAGFQQQFLYVRNRWGDMCLNMPTANETVLWGPNPGDQFSMKEPAKYGPYGMQYAGGTWDSYGPQTDWYNARRGDWWVGPDGPEPETRSWGSLWDGLNQVQFRNILLSGKHECGEGFEATAGVFGVDAPQTGVLINTDQESGTFTIDAVSPVDGLGVAGFMWEDQPTWFRNQDVPQGKHASEEWPADLLDGWVYTFEAENLNWIEVDAEGPQTSDIGLYLLFDANDDGLFNLYDNSEAVASSCCGSDLWLSYGDDFNNGPAVRNGTYAVVMYGNWIEPGDQFNLKLTLWGGGLTFNDTPIDLFAILDAEPGVPLQIQVDWEVPGPGVWEGIMYFVMPYEQGGGWYIMEPEIVVPVVINKEGVLPTIQKDVSQEIVHWGDEVVYTITIENPGAETAWMQVTDVLPEGLELIDEWTEWNGITSVLATQAPEAFQDQCDMWYDGWMRTVHYDCYLPLEYDGQIYTQDTITFRARVEAQPGLLSNKADLKVYYGDVSSGFYSDTADIHVPYSIYLPLAAK
ncbi:MAG: S8 family serine peptidase [Anaerolineae bacterium]|nr:S8 family serine peptidase [Anaerolineae bacterium]